MPEDLPTSAPEPALPPTYGPPMPPPTGRTSPWVWVSLAMSSVALLATIGLPLVAMLAIAAFVELDSFDDDFGGDSPSYYVDQGSVIDAVEEPCESMVDAAGDIALGGPTDKAATSLRQWAAAAQGIVVAIDDAHPNADSRQWRDEWKSTIKAVNGYAEDLGKPKNQLTLPDVESMYWETDADCGVPVVIAGLDPEWAGYMLGE